MRSPLVLSVLALSASPALAGSWIESSVGDLSGNRLSPSLVAISLGNNAVAGTFGSGDLDYLRIDVPAGLQVSAINVTAYSGPSVSFLAVQSGPTFTVTPATAAPASLLGYAHFGSADLNSNILPDLSTAFGAIGFTPPLNPGSYTLWLQDTGGTVSYGLSIVAVPAPASAAVLGLGVLTLRRRRR